MRARCGDIDVAWFEWGSGEPLVLVHGLADDHRAWRKTLAGLALLRRVIAYDVRGHGGTSLGSADGRLPQLGNDLVGLLDVLELAKADLCGFSMGGTIVLRVAIDHPERVGRLIPVATSSRVGRSVVPWYEERAALAAAGAAAVHPVLEKDTYQQFSGAPGEAADHWRIRRESTADPRGYGNACRAMARLNAEPLDPELGRVQAPTLVIAAENDLNCPVRAAEAVVARIPGARLQVISGSGHQVEVEKPAELAAAILGFEG
jgi:pimeloyl-ACP methyl ester carboxylesterase